MTKYVAKSTSFVSVHFSFSRVDNICFQVARIFSGVLGRTIVHHKLTQQELELRHQSNGNSQDFAHYLASLDMGIANGAEDQMNNVVQDVLGREAQKSRDFVEANRAVW